MPASSAPAQPSVRHYAYRFARGEEVTASNGEHIKLHQPPEFLVTIDHSSRMGVMGEVLTAGELKELAIVFEQFEAKAQNLNDELI